MRPLFPSLAASLALALLTPPAAMPAPLPPPDSPRATSTLERDFLRIKDSAALAKFIHDRIGKLTEPELRSAVAGTTAIRLPGYAKPIRLADVAGTLADIDNPNRLEKRPRRAVAEICSYVGADGTVNRFHILALDERDKTLLSATTPEPRRPSAKPGAP